MSYLTYSDYMDMGGIAEETAFNLYEFQAESIINWYTFDRLCDEAEDKIPEAVHKCMFLLIQMIQRKSELLNTAVSDDDESTSADDISKRIVSQSNDGVSVTYSTLSSSELISSYGDEFKAVVIRSLRGVVNSLGHKLLYRGIYPNE